MSYLGSKEGAGVYQAIIGLMPPHDTYIEPFAGSAAIFFRKPPAARSILIEKDPEAAGDLSKTRAGLAGVLAEIYEADGIEFLEGYRPKDRCVIYADPPYPLVTRTSEKRYRCELTDADHERLAVALRCRGADGAAVIVSSYPSALYDDLYAGWNTRQFQAMTRGGPRTEQVWFNFEPGAVHWHTFAGRDYIDRQRIKRKAARWARMFAAMPPAERQAVLAAILASDPPSA